MDSAGKTAQEFLSRENRAYVVGVLRGFLSQRLQLQVEEARIAALLDQAMGPILQEHGQTEPLEVLNRRLMLAVKNSIVATAPGPRPGPAPIAEAIEPHTMVEETDEFLFLRKVQQLEEVRRMPLVGEGVAPPAPVVDEVTETKVPPPAPVATTLYVPAPQEHHQPICIHAWDREWSLYNERCLFPWNGPILPILDRGSLQMAALLLPIPLHVGSQTPYVRVCIEGAGRQRSETLCIPTGEAGVWRPCSKEMSYVRAHALPWTITLKGAEDQPLDLGLDGWRVTRVTVVGGILRMVLAHDSYPGEAQRLRQHFDTGEWVRVAGDAGAGEVRLRVSAVYDAQQSLDLFLPLGETEGAEKRYGSGRWVGAGVLNLSRQPVLVLEGNLKK